jgi:hypothetical protein
VEPISANAVPIVSPVGEGSVIWAYIIIIAVIAFIPHLIDIILTYKSKMKLRKALLDPTAREKFTSDEFKKLIEEASKPPKGIVGLSRGTMAILVIAILGIALFHLLTTRQNSDSQIISNVISMLGSLIAAIVGFYFGGKASEESSQRKYGDQESGQTPDTKK